MFVGKGALFEKDQDIGVADVTDGTSNTLMVVEAKEAVPWTKPDDLSFDPAAAPSLDGAGSPHPGGFNASMADGSVRFLQEHDRPERVPRLDHPRRGRGHQSLGALSEQLSLIETGMTYPSLPQMCSHRRFVGGAEDQVPFARRQAERLQLGIEQDQPGGLGVGAFDHADRSLSRSRLALSRRSARSCRTVCGIGSELWLLEELRDRVDRQSALDRRHDFLAVETPDPVRGPIRDPVEEHDVDGIGIELGRDDVVVRQNSPRFRVTISFGLIMLGHAPGTRPPVR